MVDSLRATGFHNLFNKECALLFAHAIFFHMFVDSMDWVSRTDVTQYIMNN